MRHRTGLRNRWRNGKSTYSRHKKALSRDVYGTFTNGKRTASENIAGQNLTAPLGQDAYHNVLAPTHNKATPHYRTHKTLTMPVEKD